METETLRVNRPFVVSEQWKIMDLPLPEGMTILMLWVCCCCYVFQWFECSSSRPSFSGDTDGGNRDGGDGGQPAEHPRADQPPDGIPHQRVSVVINDADAVPQRVHQHQGNQLSRIVPDVGGATSTAGLRDTTAIHDAERHYAHQRHRCRHHQHHQRNSPVQRSPSHNVFQEQHQVPT